MENQISGPIPAALEFTCYTYIQHVIKELLKKLIARCDFLGMNLLVHHTIPIVSSHAHKIKTFKLFLTGTRIPSRAIYNFATRDHYTSLLWSYENSVHLSQGAAREGDDSHIFPPSPPILQHFLKTRTGKLQ
jgi:hypothetical protein